MSRPTENQLITENTVLRHQPIVLHHQVEKPVPLRLASPELYHIKIRIDVSGLHENLFLLFTLPSSALPPLSVHI
jgi:hypothetical protein